MKKVLLFLGLSTALLSGGIVNAEDRLEVTGDVAQRLYQAMGDAGIPSQSASDQGSAKKTRTAHDITCSEKSELQAGDPEAKPELLIFHECSLQSGERKILVDTNDSVAAALYKALGEAGSKMTNGSRSAKSVYCVLIVEHQAGDPTDPGSSLDVYSCSVQFSQ